VVDIVLAVVVSQAAVLDYTVSAEDHPLISAWYNSLKETTSFRESHADFFTLAASLYKRSELARAPLARRTPTNTPPPSPPKVVAMPMLYWHALDVDSRSVLYFAHASSIPLRLVAIDVAKGEQRSADYVAVNAAGTIPFLVDGNVRLGHTGEIVAYLAAKYHSPLYPLSSLRELSDIDAAVRLLRELLSDDVAKVTQSVISGVLGGADAAATNIGKALSTINDRYFRHSTNHMIGELYSLADVVLATHLAQLTTVKFDLSPFASVSGFYEYQRSTAAFKQAHADFFAKLADIAIASSSKLPVKPPILYWYPLSPPARTVNFFARAAGIELELRNTNLRHGEQRSPEYLAINPHGKVPALVDGELKIYESAAIIRYLAAKSSSRLFPLDDLQAQARIDMVVEFIIGQVAPEGTCYDAALHAACSCPLTASRSSQ